VLYSPPFAHLSEGQLSPILVRPVREQLEHDRVIRLLQAKYKKKFDVAANLGPSQTTPVVIGSSAWYPDLVLLSTDRAKKPVGTVEVETAESVNHLEAMSQWATFARLRAPLHLYVPAASVDVTKRLCADLQIPVAEIWAFSSLGEQVRFALVYRSARATEARARTATRGAAKAVKRTVTAARPTRRSTPAAKPARKAASGQTASTGRRRPAVRKASSTKNAGAKKKTAGPSKTRKRK
jgi:hypothetical protein